jgi:hypothetical protein
MAAWQMIQRDKFVLKPATDKLLAAVKAGFLHLCFKIPAKIFENGSAAEVVYRVISREKSIVYVCN